MKFVWPFALILILAGCLPTTQPTLDGLPAELKNVRQTTYLKSFAFLQRNNPTLSADTIGVVDQTNHRVAIELPYGTDPRALKASFSFLGAHVEVDNIRQVSGITAHDFGHNIAYTVVATNGERVTYTVIVTDAANTDASLSTFQFLPDYNLTSGLRSNVDATIDGTTVTATIPSLVDTSQLIATFESGAYSVKVNSIPQVSSQTANNFGQGPLTYSLLAESGTQTDYNVTVLQDAISLRKYLKASVIQSNHYFGTSVAISDRVAVVGLPGEDSSSDEVLNLPASSVPSDQGGNEQGAAYIYEYTTNGVTGWQEWQKSAYLKAPNNSTNGAAQFGFSVAVDQDWVIVGAPYEDQGATNAGAAYLYQHNSTTDLWEYKLTLKAAAANLAANANFGYSVAIHETTAVIGAPFENGSQGAVYVFARNQSSGTWALQARLVAPNGANGDRFGHDVAIDGETIVVGAPYDHHRGVAVYQSGDDLSFLTTQASSYGGAYVFARSNATSWAYQAYLKPRYLDADDRFGISVAISGETIVVGADGEDASFTGVMNGPLIEEANNSASEAGAAYVYKRAYGRWMSEAYLKGEAGPSGNVANDLFGHDVAIYENAIVVGAPSEDSSVTSVIEDQDYTLVDEASSASGAAYLYQRSLQTNVWSLKAYLKPPEGDSNDQFGPVALDGSTILVGAPYEDSNGSYDSNDTISASGAAYIFH